METYKSTSEIVESLEELDPGLKLNKKPASHCNSDARKRYSIEDDINHLFQAIDNKSSSCRSSQQKSALKRPISIGISEPVSLKQALRGLCISQAAEMAAMKRQSRPLQSPGGSETVAIKRLYSTMAVDHASTSQANSITEEVIKQQSAESESNKTHASTEISRDSSMQGKKKGGLVNSVLSRSGSSGGAKLSKSSIDSTTLIKPIFLAKSFVKKKAKMESTSPSENDKNEKTKSLVTISDESSRSKGEFSQSSESSAVDCSSSPSISREIIVLGSSRSRNRPHMSKDLRWEAIHQAQSQNKILCLTSFKMVRKLGVGDIGSVYLAELSDSSCLFALKVMDNEYLSRSKKLHRVKTEKEILHVLDHPFLPTLYAHFETDKFTYLVIDYCPGGDLHVRRQKQPCRSFSEHAVRFYGAEVLLALEYLHMLGVIYRDLKPENILIREDGHIMLADFDSSLKCAANTMILKSTSHFVEPTKKSTNPSEDNSCIHPLCLQPSWQVPCFSPKLPSTSSKSRKTRLDPVAQVNPLPQLVVEPISARSNSIVGTHEYLAPEIIKSEGHGNGVDWWTYGILLFELLYGKTPFKGSSNEETLNNIVSESLRFPDTPMVSFHARDLIRSLLIKEPENRLGSVKGAAEIKLHPFFDGLNWALIRCTVPPELPKVSGETTELPFFDSSKKEGSNLQVNENIIELEEAFGLF